MILAAIVAATPPNQNGYGFFFAGANGAGMGVGGGPTANSVCDVVVVVVMRRIERRRENLCV